MIKAVDKSGRWTVVSDEYQSARKVSYAVCECACGVSRPVRTYNLESGYSYRCSGDCEEYIRQTADKLPKDEINSVVMWLQVFNNDLHFKPTMPSEPTSWPPGSKKKMEVMSRRLQDGEALFHPEDARDCEGMPTVFNYERTRLR